MMIKLSPLLAEIKSPILIVGLFCLVLLLVGCTKPSNPDDVAVRFWTALAENKLDKAKEYSTEDSAALFDKRLRNASVQVGKVKYVCDGATVETQITLQSAAASSSFKTFLIRDTVEDKWKVDYPHTLKSIDTAYDKRFKNILTTTKDAGESVGSNGWTLIKELGKSLIDKLMN